MLLKGTISLAPQSYIFELAELNNFINCFNDFFVNATFFPYYNSLKFIIYVKYRE